MATLKTPSISISRNHLFLFLGLVFIFLVLVHSSDDPTNNSSPMFSNISTQTPVVPAHNSSNESAAAAASSSSSYTANVHPGKTKNSHTIPLSSSSSSTEFEAGEHEVPSGPNPISN